MSTYTTTLHVPVTATGDSQDEAVEHLEQLLADLTRAAASHGAQTGEVHVDRLRPVTAARQTGALA